LRPFAAVTTIDGVMARSEVVVGRSSDVVEGGRSVVSVDGEEIGIFRVDGSLHAWSNYCMHLGGPVCQGLMINRVGERIDGEGRSLGDYFTDEMHIVCPWHGYEYNITTGEHAADPSIRLHRYTVHERDGEILVEL
jgi:nitrite reductase/ring-hydroxylating ferredoxin subunit